MALTEAARTYMTRKEASAYLTKKWFPMSPATLARHASAETGPKYSLAGGPTGRAIYEVADLDAWAMRHRQPAPSRCGKTA